MNDSNPSAVPSLPVRVRRIGFAVSLIFSLFSTVSLANPVGGKVVSGSGAIVATSPGRLDIEQSSERLGIDWREFSIGEGERVHFAQPSRGSIALNRVRGAKVSEIRGRLTATGNVFLVNRNGVIFHGGASVDVGGLLATTSEITNGDFMAGRYRFTPPAGGGGRIVNEGRISVAEGGLVALVGPQVANAGVIEARLGRVVLGSGSAYTVDLYGDELVSFAVGGERVRGLVEQSGEIEAEGGRVWLTAGKAKGVVDGVINLSGVVRARTVSSRGGRIVLAGGGVQVSGEVDASGGAQERGGRIEVTGERIQIGAGASVDASGGSGGGTVLVGGDYQGGGGLRHARTTTIEGGSTIRADATQQGDGGTVVVWSDERTQVDGSLSSRGGPGGGDGGLVETSSAGELGFTEPADVSAAKGSGGTWLLDPADIEIDRGKADSIEAALNGGGNVSIRTSEGGEGEGNISVNASITKTEGGDASLSLRAHNRIEVNQPIRSEAGKLGVRLEAGKEVNVKAGIETNGGGFTSKVIGVKAPEPASDGETQSEDSSSQVEVVSSQETVDAQTESETEEVAGSDGGGAVEETSQATEANTDPEVDSETQLTQNSDTPGDTTSDPVATGLESTVPEAQAEPQSTSGPALQWVTVSDRVATHGGGISVDAGDSGVSLVTGTLDSSNLEQGQRGGDIEVLGQHVVLAGQAELDASGDAGGGDIHIGGDYQGNGERRQAQTTTVGKDVTIRSDAIGEGDAGDVVVWSRGTTRYSGSISARGGPEGGDGGDVEVSGKENLGFWGVVDAGAPRGAGGSLLLDPSFLRVIDAERGDGELDIDAFCETEGELCWMPGKRFLPPPGVTEDPADVYIFPEEFAALGIDPDPETPLNTLSWGRLKQLAQVTGFGVSLEADWDITFAALNGTVSTRGSPTGSNDGWTIRLALSNPERLRFDGISARPTFLGLKVLSHHGNIAFENPHDNLLVYGGFMSFEAPQGELHLGNLYAPGRANLSGITDANDLGWKVSRVDLRAGGDIEVGGINTRIDPARLVDPLTGGPKTQTLVAGPGGIDLAGLDPALLSDPYQGGFVVIPGSLVASTGGNIDIHGPVYTGTGGFRAWAAGTFTATVIDTGANRFLVDGADINTLNTGDVDIAADKITFDRINAGQVSLNAYTDAPDAITGMVVFDTFRSDDFNLAGSTPGHRDQTSPGLTLTVGDAPSIDLMFNLGDVGQATNPGPGTVSGLTGGFSFSGGDLSGDGVYVPPTSVQLRSSFVSPPGAVPIQVPLDLPSQPGAGLADIRFVPARSAVPSVGGTSPPPAIGTPMGITFTSSSEVERIRNEGEESESTGDSGGCPGESNFEWLEEGPRSAARELDWGRRSGVGTDPEDTKDVFEPASCYFAG